MFQKIALEMTLKHSQIEFLIKFSRNKKKSSFVCWVSFFFILLRTIADEMNVCEHKYFIEASKYRLNVHHENAKAGKFTKVDWICFSALFIPYRVVELYTILRNL